MASVTNGPGVEVDGGVLSGGLFGLSELPTERGEKRRVAVRITNASEG